MATIGSTTSTHSTNGDGSTTNFSIPFPFITAAEIDVTVGGSAKTINTDYTISGSTITFTTAPADQAVIKLERNTNIATKKIDFQDGSVLTESDLDTNADQLLFSMQEIVENGVGGFTVDSTNKVDGSVVYYDSSSANFKADSTTTKLTIVDGGSF